MSSRSHVGVTLIELMVTISLIVILLALAVPSLQSLVRKAELRSAAREFAQPWFTRAPRPSSEVCR